MALPKDQFTNDLHQFVHHFIENAYKKSPWFKYEHYAVFARRKLNWYMPNKDGGFVIKDIHRYNNPFGYDYLGLITLDKNSDVLKRFYKKNIEDLLLSGTFSDFIQTFFEIHRIHMLIIKLSIITGSQKLGLQLYVTGESMEKYNVILGNGMRYELKVHSDNIPGLPLEKAKGVVVSRYLPLSSYSYVIDDEISASEATQIIAQYILSDYNYVVMDIKSILANSNLLAKYINQVGTALLHQFLSDYTEFYKANGYDMVKIVDDFGGPNKYPFPEPHQHLAMYYAGKMAKQHNNLIELPEYFIRMEADYFEECLSLFVREFESFINSGACRNITLPMFREDPRIYLVQ